MPQDNNLNKEFYLLECMPYSPLEANRRFGGAYHFHLQTSACYLLLAGFLHGLLFGPEDGGKMFLRNVDLLSTDYTEYRNYTSIWDSTMIHSPSDMVQGLHCAVSHSEGICFEPESTLAILADVLLGFVNVSVRIPDMTSKLDPVVCCTKKLKSS
jgi:hypothetical protein